MDGSLRSREKGFACSCDLLPDSAGDALRAVCVGALCLLLDFEDGFSLLTGVLGIAPSRASFLGLLLSDNGNVPVRLAGLCWTARADFWGAFSAVLGALIESVLSSRSGEFGLPGTAKSCNSSVGERAGDGSTTFLPTALIDSAFCLLLGSKILCFGAAAFSLDFRMSFSSPSSLVGISSMPCSNSSSMV